MKTFKRGGIHPPEMKHLSKDKPIEEFPPPQELAVPLLQHLGKPAKCVVKVGEEIKKGRVIGEADGYVSSFVHSPISGKVKAIEARENQFGKLVTHVIITNDFKEDWNEGLNTPVNWEGLKKEEIIEIIRRSGIVGMGGAAFPTHVKLSPPPDKNIDIAILNGVECEPYLTSDHRLMLEHPHEILEGLKIIMKVLAVKEAFIGIEANKKDAYDRFKGLIEKEGGIKIELLDVKYPQGAEKQLIEAITKREVPPGKLPLDVGVVVQNVGTAYAIYEAVAKNIPLIERLVTVTGDGVEKPANLKVKIGTPIGAILEKQGLYKRTKKIIMGGPMMGTAVFQAGLPVVKGTSGILAMADVPSYVPGPCIRCGKCIAVCPLGGMAAEMVEAIEAGEIEKFERLHILDCMECGACTFVCPAKRPNIHYIKYAKDLIALERAKRKR